MKVRLITVVVALAAALLVMPQSARGVVLGADVTASSGGAPSCTFPSHCTFVQTRLPGRATKAPFDGRITRFRVQEPKGTLWLQVVKRRPSGKFVATDSSGFKTPQGVGDNEVLPFKANLDIRKGQYVAISLEDFGASALNGTVDPDACHKGFVPGLEEGVPAAPNLGFTGCGTVLLYNATLRK